MYIYIYILNIHSKQNRCQCLLMNIDQSTERRLTRLDLLIYSLNPNQSCQKSLDPRLSLQKTFGSLQEQSLGFLVFGQHPDKLRSFASWSSCFCEGPGPMVWIVEKHIYLNIQAGRQPRSFCKYHSESIHHDLRVNRKIVYCSEQFWNVSSFQSKMKESFQTKSYTTVN